MTEFVEPDRRELHFDRKQATAIAYFLLDELGKDAGSFRLMLDVFPDSLNLTAYVFPDSLDLTAYGSDGLERNHIHPRPDYALLSTSKERDS